MARCVTTYFRQKAERQSNSMLTFLFSSGKSNRKLRGVIAIVTVVLLTIALSVGILAPSLSKAAQAAPTSTLVPFAGTVPTLLAHSSYLGPVDRNTSINLSFGLRLRYASELKGYVEDITRPTSVNYHHYLTPKQFMGVYAPTQVSYNALIQYVQSSGFSVVNTYQDRLLVTFKGTVGLAEQVFHVTINNYSTNGQSFYSNTTDPQLPSTIVGAIQSFDGLNNALHWQHAPLTSQPLSVQSQTAGAPNVSCIGHGNGYYTPDQIASGYNLNGLYGQGYHGEGQTVALFELDSFQASDLSAYESCFGNSHAMIQTIKTGPDPIPADSGMI